MIKYGTYSKFKCTHCGRETEVAAHADDAPRLEKYASYCTHNWEEVKLNVTSNKEKSDDLHAGQQPG